MRKKNIRPQQVAPVQRETVATTSVAEKGMVPLNNVWGLGSWMMDPFAGDDGE